VPQAGAKLIFVFAEVLNSHYQMTLPGVIQLLSYENIDNLPPGGGLESK